MKYVEQVVNRTITVGTSPVVVTEQAQPNEEWVEVTVSNQSAAAQSMVYAPTDGDLSEGGGMFMAVGGHDSVRATEGYPISQKRRMVKASAASGTLYLHARKLIRGIL